MKNLESVVLRAIRTLSHGHTKFPNTTKFEYSPFVFVTRSCRNEDHMTNSIGAFVLPFMSPSLKFTTVETKRICFDLTDQLIGARPFTTGYATKTNTGKGFVYPTPEGDFIIVTVGGVPNDEADFYLKILMEHLHSAKLILLQSEMRK